MTRTAVFVLFAFSAAIPSALAVDAIERSPLALPEFRPAQPPPGVHLALRQVAGGLELPIYLTTAPDQDRLYVLERKGRIRTIENGDLNPKPFLDLAAEVDWAGERGLLGLAFDPEFVRNRRFYVCYTDRRTHDTVVARFRAKADGTGARMETRGEILRVQQPKGQIDHKAGWIGFRPGEPRYLYISTGDGGGANDMHNNAQNLRSRLGKLLRVDVSGKGSGFAIPRDNPFAGRKDADPAIWAYGLRNPFRCSFDRVTGDLYIADVGQDSREEINYEPAGSKGGRNYGWRLREGKADNPAVATPAPEDAVDPIFDYAHGSMMVLRGCVIGGYVYRGAAIPRLHGAYFFADFPNASILSFNYRSPDVEDFTDWTDQFNPAHGRFAFSGMPSFGEDNRGEIYLLDITGSVYRLDEQPQQSASAE